MHNELVENHYRIDHVDQLILRRVNNEEHLKNYNKRLKKYLFFKKKKKVFIYRDVMVYFLVHLVQSNEVFQMNFVYYDEIYI